MLKYLLLVMAVVSAIVAIRLAQSLRNRETTTMGIFVIRKLIVPLLWAFTIDGLLGVHYGVAMITMPPNLMITCHTGEKTLCLRLIHC